MGFGVRSSSFACVWMRDGGGRNAARMLTYVCNATYNVRHTWKVPKTILLFSLLQTASTKTHYSTGSLSNIEMGRPRSFSNTVDTEHLILTRPQLHSALSNLC